MTYERSKAPLALMEQIIMILVFALAAAVCLQAFVSSDYISKKSSMCEAAAADVQTLSEYGKAYKGDLEQVAKAVGGIRQDNHVIMPDKNQNIQVILEITEQNEWLEKARVYAVDGNNQEIYAVDIAWQRSVA